MIFFCVFLLIEILKMFNLLLFIILYFILVLVFMFVLVVLILVIIEVIGNDFGILYW